MEDQNVKRYFLKRAIILGCIALIAVAAVFGVKLVKSVLPIKIWLVDVCDDKFTNYDILEQEHRVEKVSVAKVVEKVGKGDGVMYFMNYQNDLSDQGYTINLQESSWLSYAIQAGYNDYIEDYNPTYSIEVSMEQSILKGAPAVIICGCSDGESYAYCAAVYYTIDGATLSYDFNYYMCEDEAEYLDGGNAISFFTQWLDSYVELLKTSTK